MYAANAAEALLQHPCDCNSYAILGSVCGAVVRVYGMVSMRKQQETQQALALSSAQLPPCAPLSSDSASSPALQHPHHQPPAAHRPTPAAQQRLL